MKSLTRNNKFFLELNSLGFNFILLSLKLKQIPFKDYEFFTYKKYYQLFENKSITNPELRNKIFFEFNKQNDFENYYSLQQWNTEETVADLSYTLIEVKHP